MIEDVKILEAVERYIAGEMSPDERVYFEGLRKSNPEIDQAVVEHTFFLQQMARFEDTRQLKAILNDTHIHLAETGLIQSPRLKGGARVVYMFNRYKRTVAVAASVAGIMMLCASALIWSLSPNKPMANSEYIKLKRDVTDINQKVEEVAKKNTELEQQVNDVASQKSNPQPVYTGAGTSFLIDTRGYLVTNAHVVDNAKYVAVQRLNGKDFRAEIVYTDSRRDIAILKIVDTAFKAPQSIPYSITKSSPDIAEPIFSLGFPREEIVYGEGYLAAKTGYKGDTMAVQIDINATSGNSGSPIINRRGEIIGVLNARQATAEGAVFAVQSKYIYEALEQLQKSDTAYRSIKLPASSTIKTMERTKQVAKITDYVYMVKVN